MITLYLVKNKTTEKKVGRGREWKELNWKTTTVHSKSNSGQRSNESSFFLIQWKSKKKHAMTLKFVPNSDCFIESDHRGVYPIVISIYSNRWLNGFNLHSNDCGLWSAIVNVVEHSVVNGQIRAYLFHLPNVLWCAYVRFQLCTQRSQIHNLFQMDRTQCIFFFIIFIMFIFTNQFQLIHNFESQNLSQESNEKLN